MTYPDINPIAIQLGPVAIYWYGLMYLLGFFLAWLGARYYIKQRQMDWTQADVAELIFYVALGVVLGGRLGYVLFYDLSYFLQHPLRIVAVWDGGMAFHGGLIGVMVALGCFSRHFNKPFLAVADLAALVTPLGIFCGRIGNFINGELWGRVTDVPWAMVFPHVDSLPRHPSQLYEALGEGIILFVWLWLLAQQPRKLGVLSGWFLIGYAIIRASLECFRAPDAHLQFVAWHWLTMGQLLSVPMLLLGGYLLWRRPA